MSALLNAARSASRPKRLISKADTANTATAASAAAIATRAPSRGILGNDNRRAPISAAVAKTIGTPRKTTLS